MGSELFMSMFYVLNFTVHLSLMLSAQKDRVSNKRVKHVVSRKTQKLIFKLVVYFIVTPCTIELRKNNLKKNIVAKQDFVSNRQLILSSFIPSVPIL